MQLKGATTRENINEGFHRYLNKVKNIKSAENGSHHQYFPGLLFALYSCNAVPVDITDIY